MDTSWTQLSSESPMESGSTWFHWTSAILGSFIVGLSGIVPLILLPSSSSKQKESDKVVAQRNLNRQLSFAVGGLLGDVFLHLVPEAYSSKNSKFFIKTNVKATHLFHRQSNQHWFMGDTWNHCFPLY